MSLEQRIERIFQYHKEGWDLSVKERTLTILYDCSSQSANNLQELVFRMKRKADFSKIGEFLHPLKLFPRDNPDNAYSFKGEKKIIRDYEKTLRKQGAQIPRTWSSKGMKLYAAQQFLYLCSQGPVTVELQEKKGIRNHLFKGLQESYKDKITQPESKKDTRESYKTELQESEDKSLKTPDLQDSKDTSRDPQMQDSHEQDIIDTYKDQSDSIGLQESEDKSRKDSQKIDPAKLRDAKKLINQTRKDMKRKDYEKASHNIETLKEIYTEVTQHTLSSRELKKINSIHSTVYSLEENMNEELDHLRLKLPELVKRNDFHKITQYSVPHSEQDIRQYMDDLDYFSSLRESLIEYKRSADLLQKGQSTHFHEKHQQIMDLIEQRPKYKETFNRELISDIENWTQQLKAYEQGQKETS
ncbi:MAG: hypothetical protein R6V53_06660 [Candidatus Woesearchaeota archaeon]